jgi:alpha-beta hydrolase superfamily lysophospholipase
VDTSVNDVIAPHRAAGRQFEAAGVGNFMRAEGSGESIVLLHGLPSSSFLYRKVISGLAGRGFAALSFDLPGLGLGRHRRARRSPHGRPGGRSRHR